MRAISVNELANLLGGTASGISSTARATGWATDSRDVKPGDLFLAIQGARVDGNEHVRGAVDAGAVAAIVERAVDEPHILVENLPNALAKMASAYRDRFAGPVIGVTGSAGKTTTKEFIAAAVSSLGPVLKTEGNRNTEYTAPLLWTELTDEHKVVVCEMGMRGFGHIEHLAGFCRPTIGVVTNIGVSHMEMVGSREGIARAKGEMLRMLPGDGAAVLWHEDDYLELMRGMTSARVRTFGVEKRANRRLGRYVPLSWSASRVSIYIKGQRLEGELPAIGRHIALDAAAAVLAASCAGVDPTAAAAGLADAKLPPLRMEVRIWNGATILVDAYNASPASMLPAIEVLKDGPRVGRRIAVIGEMRELGEASVSAHRAVGVALADARLDAVVLYGAGTDPTYAMLRASGQRERTITRANELAEIEAFLRRELQPDDVALIKGSRSLELEKAVPQ